MRDSGTGEDKGSFPKCQCGEEKNWGSYEKPLPWGNKWGNFLLQYSGKENTKEFPEPLVQRWGFGTRKLLEDYRMGTQQQSTWGGMILLWRLQTAPCPAHAHTRTRASARAFCNHKRPSKASERWYSTKTFCVDLEEGMAARSVEPQTAQISFSPFPVPLWDCQQTVSLLHLSFPVCKERGRMLMSWKD